MSFSTSALKMSKPANDLEKKFLMRSKLLLEKSISLQNGEISEQTYSVSHHRKKKKQQLRDEANKGNLQQKKKRTFNKEDVDAALFILFKKKLAQDARLNRPILQEKAKEMDVNLNHQLAGS